MQIEPSICPACGGRFNPLRARATLVTQGRVRAFCSAECKERALRGETDEDDGAAERLAEADRALHEARMQAQAAKRRRARRRNLALAGIGAAVLAAVGVVTLRGKQKAPVAAAVSLGSSAVAAEPPEPKVPARIARDPLALLAAVDEDGAPDVWVHPLPGYRRQLPIRGSRRFGAGREGMRPEECGGGHCGVDLGVDKGEIVMAVHDGVIERVVRDAEFGGRRGNEGRFIRVNHKGGTVVSSYMHLDGVREDLKPGVPVKAGEPIGTVGATGVHISGPHLHFAISVRQGPDESELFIDPEPLLRLWPTRKEPLPTKHAMELPPPKRPRTAAVNPTAMAQPSDEAPTAEAPPPAAEE
jgi:murein DD-endopeptidase MepM/ murein hydrolase activator NlpD